MRSGETFEKLLSFGYRHRWITAAVTMLAVIGALVAGGARVDRFSAQIDSLKDPGSELRQPRLFDTRTDIWFDPADEGRVAYQDIEDQFIAEDVVLVAFEEPDAPWGVFDSRALEAVARLTEKLQRIPYVRSVRSLTQSPWIRWGEAAPGEEGLVVGDLFDRPVGTFTERERLERMIAVLGAERAAAIVGEDTVRSVVGADAKLEHFAGEPRFINSIVSEDARTAAIQLQVLRQRPTEAELDEAFGPGDDAAGRDIGPTLHAIESQTQAVAAIKKVLREEKAYATHLAGIPVLEQHFPEVGMRDMAFMGLMFLAMGLVLFGVYRRFGGVSIPLLVVTSSIMGMLGIAFVAGDLINNLTATAPVVMTAVGIADAVHLTTAYYSLRPRFSDKRELVLEVVRRNAVPVLLTSLTTAVAFFSLITSDIVPVKMFGYTAGIGTLIAYVVSMTVVPALLSSIPVKRASHAGPSAGTSDPDRHWTDSLLAFVLRRRAIVLVVSMVVAGVSVLGMSNVAVESDLRLMFPDDDPVTSDLRWIEERLGGAGDLDIVFYGGEIHDGAEVVERRQSRIQALQLRAKRDGALPAGGREELSRLEAEEADHQRRRIASSAAFLSQVDAFERRLASEAKDSESPLSVLTSVDSGLSVLRRVHQVQNENDPSFYRTPIAEDVPERAREPVVMEDDVMGETVFIPAQTASSLTAQYYLQYENGAKPSQNLASIVTQDRRGFRIAARVSSRATADVLKAYERIRAIAEAEFPMLTGSVEDVESGAALSTLRMTGKHYLFMNMLERFTETLIVSMMIAVGLVTLLIAVVFRSALLGVVSMIPNVLPLVVPLGFLGVIDVALDGPAVIVATVALGVCVDDTIHFLTKFRDAQRTGASVEQALRHAFRRVGSAVTWTTLVLLVGFSALAFSDFRPNMMIGVLGAAMVLLAWVADLLVTPALLSYVGARDESSERAPESLSPAQSVG